MGNNTVLVIIIVCFCAWDKYIRIYEWMTDGQNGWMDGLTVFVIFVVSFGLKINFRDYLKLPVWIVWHENFSSYRVHNVYHISFTHERFVWIFAWPKMISMLLFVWGNCILSCCVYCICTFFFSLLSLSLLT